MINEEKNKLGAVLLYMAIDNTFSMYLKSSFAAFTDYMSDLINDSSKEDLDLFDMLAEDSYFQYYIDFAFFLLNNFY